MIEEITYTCPCCGRGGFCRRGLSSHRCDGGLEYAPKLRLTPNELAQAYRSAQCQGLLFDPKGLRAVPAAEGMR